MNITTYKSCDLEARVEADFAEDVTHVQTLVEVERPHES